MSEGSRSSMDSKTSSTPDYYDIPKHLLPSSNFANRPASDISMLGGALFESMPDAFELSAHVDDDYDSESEAEASTKSIEWTLSRPDKDIDAQPHITITAPQEESSAAQSQPELSECSVPANTPAVASASSSTPQPIVPQAPPPPRKRASSFGFKRSRSAHNMESLMQPQQVEQARPRSSSGVRKMFRREEAKPEQETSSAKGKGKFIEKEKRLLRKARSAEKPVLLPKGKAKVVVQDDKLVDAFVQKAKEQKSLLQRKLDMLVMDNEEGENRTKRSDLHQRSHSAGMDTEEFEAKILPSRPRTSSGVESRGRIPSLSESTTASESSLEQDEKAEEDSCAAKRRIYLPGRINVERPSPKFSQEARSPSEWLQPVRLSLMRQSQRTSDLDGIVMFFEEFGVMEDVTDESFDKYWLAENQRIHNDAPSSGAKKPRC